MVGYDLLLPTLKNYNSESSCYYGGKYITVKKIIASEELKKKNKSYSHFANIAILENNVIVKWNRNKDDKSKFYIEVRYQNIMYVNKLGVKIHQYYQTKDNIYIFMDNLLFLKYKPLDYILKKNKFNQNIAENIAKAIDRMHRLCLIHGDIHESNIFYNLKTNDVKFIDFEKSEFMVDYSDSVEKESYVFQFEITEELIFNELDKLELI